MARMKLPLLLIGDMYIGFGAVTMFSANFVAVDG